MEVIKKILAVAMVCTLSLHAAALSHNEHPLFPEQLPGDIQLLIKENFSNLSIARATFASGNYYEIVLSDHSILEFDTEGNWTKIECQGTEIPNPILPAAVVQFVKENHPGKFITRIEKERSEYEVKLSDHTELTFDSNCQLLVTDFDCPDIISQ